MKQLTWPMVGLTAVLGLVAVGLAAFTDWGSGEILGLVGILAGTAGGAAVGGVVAGGVSGRVDQLAAETTAQTEQLETIGRRVNGELDARIAEAVQRGNADLLAELERRERFR